MISIDDHERLMKIEMVNQVKSIKGWNGSWVSCPYDKDMKYYNDDPVLSLKGVGKNVSQ